MNQPASLTLDLRKASIISVGFPIFAQIFAISYSILFDYNRVMASEQQCEIEPIDYLPTVTSCYSRFYPQIWFWMFGMALPLWPRLIVPFLFYKHHISPNFIKLSKFNFTTINSLSKIALVTDVLDIISITSLSFIVYAGVREEHIEAMDIFHYGNFGVFLVATTVYMFVTVVLEGSTLQKGMCPYGSSLNLKNSIFKLHVLATIGAGTFCCLRLANPCTSYFQTCFAACEYTICATNSCFHLVQVLDYSGYKIKFHKKEDDIAEKDCNNNEKLMRS